MINWDKEQYIREIERKLSSQVPLSCLEIKTVIAALRESFRYGYRGTRAILRC